MKIIDRSKIPCKFEQIWWEDVVGDGGPRMQMSDCDCDIKLTEKELEDFGDKCDKTCPGYHPVEIGNCPKHGEFLVTDGCGYCEEEAMGIVQDEIS